ncbi:HNH endonuclease signature motif containing protein [Cellulomonas sp. Root485]|uniref:HNH endonuclease signature motif containing protein n=1 Tax=Cellulomonas sp. Root485 TaxID=1736546 RepID=UPI0012FA3DA4|nr:HNH endonuclease signature motif containing protein [Cellulomonas sp. Root485]
MTAVLEDRLDATDLACDLAGVAASPGGAQAAASRVVNLREVPAFPIPAVEIGALASMLSTVPVADVSDVALVNMVSAWQQVLNMAQAAQAEVIREIEARTTDALARVPDEVACALACTRRAATDLFLRAWGAGQHPSLTDAWARGAVDARKVDVILAETVHAAPDAVGAVITDAVARAGDLTAPQLTRHVRAAVIATGPHVAERRRVAERSRRSVELVLAPDAMARLVAYLPAEHATAAFTAIDALAGHAAVDGDDRTVDQRRADAFTDIFTSILDRQTTPDGTPLPRRHGQRASIQVTVAATTLLGLDDHPATLGSYGPIPAQVARELAQDATWRRIVTDPTGQAAHLSTATYRPGADLTRTVAARDRTCTFPGCRQPAARCEIDHREPYDHARAPGRPADAPPGDGADARPGGPSPTSLENLHALCKHHHQAKTRRWWKVTWDPMTGVSTWTDRHGLTYARQPERIHTTPDAFEHRPPPPPGLGDLGDPPF